MDIEKRRRVSFVLAGLFIVAVISLAIGIGQLYSNRNAKPTVVPKNSDTTLAVVALNKMPIKGRAPKTGYSRDQFGKGWGMIFGCDSRNYILKRDLINPKLATDNCTVLSGTLLDPYTAKKIEFKRGAGTSSAVQIDHVVALSDSWQKGAQQLTTNQREALANDPLELLAVDGTANQQKADGDAATWLPTNKDYRCRYVARQIAVKQKYSLWVTRAEHDAMARVLARCPNQVLPVTYKKSEV